MPIRAFSVLLLAATLAACSERPQNFYQSDRRVEDRDQTALYDARRQRTLHENEGDRVHNEGTLR